MAVGAYSGQLEMKKGPAKAEPAGWQHMYVASIHYAI